MRTPSFQSIAAAATMLAGLAGASFVQAQGQEPIQAIVPPQQVNLGLVELGKKLYFDPRLSKSGFISCNSCHNLSRGGQRQPAHFHRRQVAAGPHQFADGAELQP